MAYGPEGYRGIVVMWGRYGVVVGDVYRDYKGIVGCLYKRRCERVDEVIGGELYRLEMPIGYEYWVGIVGVVEEGGSIELWLCKGGWGEWVCWSRMGDNEWSDFVVGVGCSRVLSDQKYGRGQWRGRVVRGEG